MWEKWLDNRRSIFKLYLCCGALWILSRDFYSFYSIRCKEQTLNIFRSTYINNIEVVDCDQGGGRAVYTHITLLFVVVLETSFWVVRQWRCESVHVLAVTDGRRRNRPCPSPRPPLSNINVSTV